MAEGAARGSGSRRGNVSRLNFLIALTAAIIGLIYGYDLGSIASAFLFLAPETKGRPLEAIRSYRYNGGNWPEETNT
jgi:hypothetical protein